MKRLLLLLTIPLLACASSHDDGPPKVYPDVPLTNIALKSGPRWKPYYPQLAHNFERMLPILNKYGHWKSPQIDVFILNDLVAPGPKAGACAISYRMQGVISLHLFAENPQGQCSGWGTVAREHWSGGFGWEFAHLLDCSLSDVCGDGAYATQEAKEVEQLLYSLPWDGEPITP